MTEDQLKFHLEEFKLLRAENALNIKYIYDTFIFAALSSGGISAWLLTNATQINALGPFPARAAWFIPLLVAFIAFLANRHFIHMSVHNADYVRKLEAEIAMPGLGWEGHERAATDGLSARAGDWRMGIGWVVLGIADVALALFVR